MELEIYNEVKKPIFLKLYKQFNNNIQLIVVNSNGTRESGGIILSIDSGGLHLKRNVNKDLGFPLDENGVIDVCNITD